MATRSSSVTYSGSESEEPLRDIGEPCETLKASADAGALMKGRALSNLRCGPVRIESLLMQ